MRIQTNLAAYSTQAKLSINNNKKSKSIEKLSGGQRINRSADDAAGISISEKMRAQIRGMNRASANVQDGISLVGVADGAMQEVTNMMHRIRELSVQASSDTNAQIDRNAIQTEVTDLINEINKQLGGANFNGIPLFDGSNVGTYEYAYGLTNNPTISPTDPAYIYANAPFAADADNPLIITGGSYASQTSAASNNYLGELNGSPPTFPKQGVFIIRVQLDSNITRDAVLDFGTANADGNFDLDDFREFYIGTSSVDPVSGKTVYSGGQFSDWINEGWMEFTIANDGAMSLKTSGQYGGSNARVTIGATSGVPSGKTLANSAIFGAEPSASASDYGYRNVDNLTATAADVATLSTKYTQQQLWDALPDTTITYSIYSYADNKYISEAAMSFNTSNYSSLAEFNDAIKATLNTKYYQDPTPISLIPSLDRDGNVYINFSNYNNITAKSPYSSYPYNASYTSPSQFDNALNSSTPSLTSNYKAAVSDKVGTLEITISGIPNSSTSTLSTTVKVDFSTNKATFGGNTIGFTDTASMAKAIQDLLNAPANHPYKTPEIKPTGYDSNKPVASVTIDANGYLNIKTAERTMTITVNERQSDRPMFYAARGYTNGTNQTRNLRIDGTPGANVAIKPGTYKSIDEFIDENAKAFEPNYILTKDSTGTQLVIQSSNGGMSVDVSNISFTTSTTPSNLLELLGFKNVVANHPSMFQDGVSYPAVAVPPSGLWIQGGANLDEGLFIYIPRLDAYDLGLMIKVEDLLAPNGSHRANGGVNGNNSIAGTGGVNMGTASYTTEANIEPIPLGYGLDVSTHEKASAAISIMDNAINIMNKERAQLGATQNRLGFMDANLNINAENLTAAESRIRDVDMAKEVTNLVRNDILSQGATAMLSVSNNFPQAVLQLLG